MKHFLTILALMFATVATYGYTDLVTPGYQPNGSNFMKEGVTVDWSTQKIVALIDVTNCTDDNENLLSLGYNISQYYRDSNYKFHIYYKTSVPDMTIAYNGSGENYLQEHKGITDKLIRIEISKANGVTVNGVSWNKSGETYNSETTYKDFFNQSSIQVGSEQDASHATYKYVRVQGLNEFVTPTITVGTLPGTTALGSNPDGYKPAGSTFTTSNVSIDWSKQKLVASIDVTNCTGQNENILSVGKNISSYTDNDGIRFHLYYTATTTPRDMTIAYNASSETYLKEHKSITDKTLLIEISKANGITVNGVSWNKVTSDFDTAYDAFFKLGTYEVGSTQGASGTETNASRDRSHATYNYIRVVDIDTQMSSEDLTFAETETESNAKTTLSEKNNTMLTSVTLTRTLTADEWNTFCVPFNITDISAFGAVKEFDSVSGSTMLFKDATSIVAGKPYLVKPKTSYIENPKFVYPTITSDTPDANVSNDNTYNFVGVYGTHTFTDDASTSYILVSGGSLVNPTANTTMNGMRAYFTYTKAGGVAPRVAIDGVETALTEVVGSEEITDGRIYNLRGMYVGNDESRLAKGIYIKNGKKVVLN